MRVWPILTGLGPIIIYEGLDCAPNFWQLPAPINVLRAQPAKMDLDKKSLHKQNTIQTFKLDTQGSEIQKMKILRRRK